MRSFYKCHMLFLCFQKLLKVELLTPTLNIPSPGLFLFITCQLFEIQLPAKAPTEMHHTLRWWLQYILSVKAFRRQLCHSLYFILTQPKLIRFCHRIKCVFTEYLFRVWGQPLNVPDQDALRQPVEESIFTSFFSRQLLS